jgi:hypothetical protein
VIGVGRDIQQRALNVPSRSAYFVPPDKASFSTPFVAIRTNGEPRALWTKRARSAQEGSGACSTLQMTVSDLATLRDLTQFWF